MYRMRGWILVAVLAPTLVLGGCSSEKPTARESAKVPFATQVVKQQVTPREQVWDGTVQAVHRATLSAQTAGRVIKLPYEVNDYVPKGAVVVRFTDVEQGAAVRAAQAKVRAAQAAYAEAQAQYRRIAKVYARSLVSKSQMDRVTAQRDTSRAALDSARQNLRAASQTKDYTVVRAPYAGILTRRFVQVGEAVRPGQPLISGLSLDQLRVEVQVPQSEVVLIRKYHRAWVVLGGGAKRIEASKVIVFPYADPQTHTFTVRLVLPTVATGLNPGEVVRVAFMVGSRPRLLIPGSSIMHRGEIVGVYVDHDNQVILRQIRLGDRFGDAYEVLSGLDPGERIAKNPIAAMDYLITRHQGGAKRYD